MVSRPGPSSPSVPMKASPGFKNKKGQPLPPGAYARWKAGEGRAPGENYPMPGVKPKKKAVAPPVYREPGQRSAVPPVFTDDRGAVVKKKRDGSIVATSKDGSRTTTWKPRKGGGYSSSTTVRA